MLKNEVKALSGRVNDLAWLETRVVAVGEGKEKFGSAFTFDSGNSVGEISGHSKPINSIAIRQQRPFRAVYVFCSLIFFHTEQSIVLAQMTTE